MAVAATALALIAVGLGGNSGRQAGTVRTYYVSADRVIWNYAPRGRNEITGRPFGPDAGAFVKSARGRIGSRYLKCLYRGYTDASFRYQVLG